MRVAVLGIAIWLCSTGTGCNLYLTAARNTTFEVCRSIDHCSEKVRDERQAETAWHRFQQNCRGAKISDDFAAGFKEGYADLLYWGRAGEPPTLPPRHYWKAKYQSPRGHQAIDEWYAGFMQGREQARLEGRSLGVTVPAGTGSLVLPGLNPPEPAHGLDPVETLPAPSRAGESDH